MENYSPKSWVNGEIVYATDMNRIEQGIAALYPQEQIVAPEQTVTITTETIIRDGVPITLAEGVDFDPAAGGLKVVVDDTFLVPESGSLYQGQLNSGAYAVVDFDQLDEIDKYSISLVVVNQVSDPSSVQVVPGDYTVKITKAVPGSGGVLVVNIEDTETAGQVVFDRTSVEVMAAAASGDIVIFCYYGTFFFADSTGTSGEYVTVDELSSKFSFWKFNMPLNEGDPGLVTEKTYDLSSLLIIPDDGEM